MSGIKVDDKMVVGMAICWESTEVYYISLCKPTEGKNVSGSPGVDPALTVHERVLMVTSVLATSYEENQSQKFIMFDSKEQMKILAIVCDMLPAKCFQV